MPAPYLDSHDLEFKYVHRITGELWDMTRTDVMKANPFPEEKGLHFYPENIYWNNLGRKYRCRYIDKALRCYINDTDNALTSSKFLSPLRETFFMRVHYINECWDYVRYAPKKFLFQIIGLSRDGLEYGYRFSRICRIPNTLFKIILTVLFFPADYLLYIRSRRSQCGGKSGDSERVIHGLSAFHHL